MSEKQTSKSAGMIAAGQAAKLLGVTTQWLRRLAADGHIPVAVKGRYPLVGVVQGYIKFLRDGTERRADDNAGASLASAREREIRLRQAQREAQIVDASDVERFHEFSSDIYRDELAGLGKTVTRDPILASIIEDKVKGAIARFDARFDEGLPKLRAGVDPLANGTDA